MRNRVMRTPVTMALVFLMVGTGGSAAVRAQQADEGWWTWATPLVTSPEGRVAIPRPRGETGETTGTRERVPPPPRDDERAAPSGRSGDAQAAGRGRGAAATAGRGQAGRGAAGRGQGNGRGDAGVPAFCRTGAGHPVFGWPWCAERGFARYQPRWERERWEETVPRWPRAPREGRVANRDLGTVLGDVVLGRVRTHANALGATDPLEARWVRPESGALVLQVRAGDVPIAELSDTTGDRRANSVIVNRTGR